MKKNKITYGESKFKKVDIDEVKKKHCTLIFTIVSCMCDNISYLRLKKDKKENTVQVHYYNDHCSYSFSNMQTEGNGKENIKWAFLDNNIEEIIRIINTGTVAVSSVKSR